MNKILKIYLLEYECENKSEVTIKNIKSRLNSFCDYIKTTDNLTKYNVNSYVLELKKRMLPQSVNEHIKTIRKFVEYCYNEDYIDKSITIKKLNTEKKSSSKGLSDKDVKRILFHLKSKNGFIANRNYTIVSMFLDTGIRVSELASLKVNEIDNTITVTCKNKRRSVPLSPKLQLVINKYLIVRSKYLTQINSNSEYLFFSRSGKQLNNDAIEKTLRRLGTELDLTLYPHLFRHYYIQSLLKKGVNIYYIARLVGHESIETTQIYLEGLKDDVVMQSVSGLSNL